MEADWGPKFLDNKQVDMGVQQHDALYDCPCCNHRVSYFNSILVALPSSNSNLSTQTVVPNTFCHVDIENGEHSHGEHHPTEHGSSLMEIDWGPKHNNTYDLHPLNTSHRYNLTKFIHHHQTNNPGLGLKEIDWGHKLLNMYVNKQVNWGVHYSSIFLYLQQSDHDGIHSNDIQRKLSVIHWTMGRKQEQCDQLATLCLSTP